MSFFVKKKSRLNSQAGVSVAELIIYIVIALIIAMFIGRALLNTYKGSSENILRNEILQMGDLFRRQSDVCRSVFQALLNNGTTAPLVDTANNRLYAPLTASQASLVGASPGSTGILPLAASGSLVNTGIYEVKFFLGGDGSPGNPLHFYPHFRRTGTGPKLTGTDISQFGNHTKVFSNLLLGQTLFVTGTCIDSSGGTPPGSPPSPPSSGSPPSSPGSPPSSPASPPSSPGSPPSSPATPPSSPGSPPSPPASPPASSAGGTCSLLQSRNGCQEYCGSFGRAVASYTTSCSTTTASSPNCNSGTGNYINCTGPSFRSPDASDCANPVPQCTCVGMSAAADIPCSTNNYYYTNCNYVGSEETGVVYFGSGGNYGMCFPKGTLIRTQNGSKAIETLKMDDAVLSFNFESNKVVENNVERIFIRKTKDFLKIQFSDSRKIRVTPEHPFYSVSKNDWIKAKDLQANEIVRTIEEKNKIKRAKIISIQTEQLKEEETVYNLEIAGDHNYFAEGVLVHNKFCNAEPEFPHACFGCTAWPGWVGTPAGIGMCTYQQLGLCGGAPCPPSTLRCLPCNGLFSKFLKSSQNYCLGIGQNMLTTNITCADTSKVVTNCAGPNNYNNCTSFATRAGDIPDCTSLSVTCDMGGSTTYTCP